MVLISLAVYNTYAFYFSVEGNINGIFYWNWVKVRASNIKMTKKAEEQAHKALGSAKVDLIGLKRGLLLLPPLENDWPKNIHPCADVNDRCHDGVGMFPESLMI